ncbi:MULTISPECIES: STAS domain-containing protein [Thermomonospora]|uniref:Anti-anti-sigma factor n=1 Tax=Thermomonospora cellulosilytica TaxID=1411118 RepID=A0A7W3R9I9_9ACTN|nr:MULTISPECIES: STAS domain-containing protein [Thermomonospora]MBA9004679.1 anti-anti-sigma factor [Thermomonospora cellulosilytica]
MSELPDFDDGSLRIERTVRPFGLSLAGEIDDLTYPALVSALDRLAAEPEYGDLHLDLSRVGFCDLAGLRAMVGLAERLEAGRRVVLHAPAPPLRTVLHVVGWDDVRGLVVEG